MAFTKSVLETNREHASLFRRVYEHAQSDLPEFNADRKIIYSFDFSIAYPYLFPATSTHDKQYDTSGRNIFTLLSLYHRACNFNPCLTIPSLIELLDVLAHRLDRLERLAASPEELQLISSQLRSAYHVGATLSEQQVATNQAIKTLQSLRVTSTNGHIGFFLSMLKAGQIGKLTDLVDPALFASTRFTADYDQILQKMTRERSITDSRQADDKNFHYRVDAWNIAACAQGSQSGTFEIDHVCRTGVSKFAPDGRESQLCRSPLVPLARLFSLFRAPSGGYLEAESAAFIKLAHEELRRQEATLKGLRDFAELTKTERNNIDRIHNEYVRPLFYDYANNSGSITIEETRRKIEEFDMGKYKSITTEEGLKERFRADSDDIKAIAKTVIAAEPLIIEDRLLSDYRLDNNPRIMAIRKKLGLE